MARGAAGRLSAFITLSCIFFLAGRFVALEEAIAAESSGRDALRHYAQASKSDPLPDPNGADRKVIFPKTLVPQPNLIARLETLFGRYFDGQVRLAAILTELVKGSAVVELPSGGRLLYNPAHMLFLQVPEASRDGDEIRIATLYEVSEFLKQPIAADFLLDGYILGPQTFSLLAGLMKHADSRETLKVVWAEGPRSDQHKKRIAYALFLPLQQAVAINNESGKCRQALNGFTGEARKLVKANNQLPQETELLPSRIMKHGKEIYLVLSEDVIARYYVIAKFKAAANSCSLVWTRSVFVM